MPGHNYSYVGPPADDIPLSSTSKDPHPDVTTTKISSEAPVPTPRSRYLSRTLVLLLVPSAVTAYYYWIWLYLLSRDLDEAYKYGSAKEVWYFWSWFIVGVFALDWAAHGLVGVEVAMLETPFFRAPHLIGLFEHSEGTWSGIGGWFRCLTKVIRERNIGAITGCFTSLKTYKLWYLLAFITLSLYIGLPLSGITMELSDGYVPVNEPPMVVGRNSSDFHARYHLTGQSTSTLAKNAWSVGSPASLPGISIIYTPEHVSRGDFDVLTKSPNTLPTEPENPEMFIVPQGEAPISGRSWGMRAGYNCSVVKDVSEFTILGHYKGSACPGSRGTAVDKDCARAYMVDPASNVWSYIEIGARMPVKEMRINPATYDVDQYDVFNSKNDSHYDVLEYALWQVRVKPSYHEVKNFNATLGPTVAGLESPFMKADNGSWVANGTFFDQKNYTQISEARSDVVKRFLAGRQAIDVAEPVGVRCVVKSALGSATIDPVSSTFSEFDIEYPRATNHPDVDAPGPVGRLGSQVEAFIAEAGVNQIFTSISVPATKSDNNGVNSIKYASSDEVQKSISLAYGKELLQLMYDGQYGFEGSWQHDNLTSSKEGKVLTPGDISPLWAVIPMGIWTLGSLILGLVYGFRRRVADSLSGFSLFRLGVHYADRLGDSGVFEAKEAADVGKLWHLPGGLDKI